MALEHAGELIAGVIFDPTRNEMFSAERGSGAYLNNRRISVSKVNRLEEMLVATGFPSHKRHLDVNVHFLLSARHGDPRRPARGLGGAGSGLCGLRPAGRLLGVWPQSLGYGGGHFADAGGGRNVLGHARRCR